MQHATRNTQHDSALRTGFTLMEVMIACGIFFMATFAILALVSNTLRNARALQRGDVDAGMAAAMVYQTIKTNRQEQGSLSGDFGNAYPDYSYDVQWGPSPLAPTNGLLEVNIILNRRGSQKPADYLSILIYNTAVRQGSPGGPMFPRP